jgi:endonuclease/exonuclease/phosphatase family metal-dependent hydrolase
LTWLKPGDVREREALERWARGVGRPVIREPAGAAATIVLDELTFVVWNAHLGAGDIPGLIADLRGGKLTKGRPVEHFVLLLQEVHRAGTDVPEDPRAETIHAGRIGGAPPEGQRIGIDALSERIGLSLVYVPSMRNGPGGKAGPPEDRGNAILSTLSLAMPRAYELPFERQRRVAVAATVRGTSTAGAPWSLDCVNVHLDPRSASWRLYRSFGSGRARQTEWLLRAIEGSGPSLIGGDFNTWTGGDAEPAIRLLRTRFSGPAAAGGGTLVISRFLPSPRVDHVFLQLPDAWQPEFTVLERTYGSDHRPIVATVRIH